MNEKAKNFFYNMRANLREKFSYISSVVYFNYQYTALSQYADSTVVKAPEVVLRGQFFSEYNRFLCEEFLLNYRTLSENMGFCQGIALFQSEGAINTFSRKSMGEDLKNSIKLLKPKKINVSLGTVIKSRRSLRHYSGIKMSFQELSTFLYYVQGISGEFKYNESISFKLRNAPSGGGLYPISIYLGILNVQNLDLGIYLYQPYSHTLKLINKNITKENIINSITVTPDLTVDKANFYIYYVYDYLVNSRKYGDSGMAYAL